MNSQPPIHSKRSADLQVQQLHIFRLVYSMGGYAAAARETGLAVPTVWQHIQNLEKLYATTLFEKKGRRVQPTPAADKLFAATDEILVALESTFDLVASSQPSDGRLVLVSGVRMMMEDLATPLAAFRQRFSNPLTLRHGNNERAEELLIAGEADLALSLGAGYQQESPLIHYEPAYSVDFLAVAPKKHKFANTRSVSLRELVKHPLIVTAPGTHGRDALEQALHREGLTANIVIETDNSGFTVSCVQAGMGLGIVAGRPQGPLLRQLTCRSMKRSLGQRQIVFMWRKGRRLTDAALALIEEVCRHHKDG